MAKKTVAKGKLKDISGGIVAPLNERDKKVSYFDDGIVRETTISTFASKEEAGCIEKSKVTMISKIREALKKKFNLT